MNPYQSPDYEPPKRSKLINFLLRFMCILFITATCLMIGFYIAEGDPINVFWLSVVLCMWLFNYYSLRSKQ